MTTKERPIRMMAHEVRALQAGTKTQKRLIMKLKNGQYIPSSQEADSPGWRQLLRMCPHGQPCERLYVRETWSPDPPIDDTWASTQWSGCGRTVSEIPDRFRHPRFCNYAADRPHGPIRWTPSIHMPRWASRITLEISEVRVQRLREISDTDAIAEGVERTVISDDWRRYTDSASELAGVHPCLTPRASYASLWEHINGPGSWEANPWVWAISFKRIK